MFICPFSGHCTMSYRTWVSRLLSITFVYTEMKCQETYGRCNCVFTLKGNTYNITSLQSTDDTARFTVEHQGYTYSYNPCRSFHFVEEPSFGDCQDDLAMCWWIKDIMYRKIAQQSTAKCDFNEQYKMPMLQYTGDGYIRKTTVLLKCNRTNKQASFEVVDTSGGGEFVFKLTHKCACPNACVNSPSGHSTKKPTTTAVPTEKHPTEDNNATVVPSEKGPSEEPTATVSPRDLENIVVPVVASVAGILGLVIALIGIWKLLCKQNDNREQPLNQNDGVGVVEGNENDFCSPNDGSECTSEKATVNVTKPSSTGSSCDITVPKKDNLNTRMYAEGLC
ncbi:uncharacterized protein LOC144656023 isoform X2 [Oculina patagonica]